MKDFMLLATAFLGIQVPDETVHQWEIASVYPVLQDTKAQVWLILEPSLKCEENIQRELNKIENLLVEGNIAAVKNAYYSLKKAIIEGFISWKLSYTNEWGTQDDIGNISLRIFWKEDSVLDALWVHFCITKLFTLSNIEREHERIQSYTAEEYCSYIDYFVGYSRK